MTSFWTTLGVGFVLGLRHALDTDHIVAVSTLVARERNVWRSTRIGAIWGLGHTATLFAMGILLVALGWQLPAGAEPFLKSAVAAMLLFLGARALWEFRKGRGHVCVHEHEGHAHAHFHRYGDHECAEAIAQPKGKHRQSFCVGVVHGLSGSAELMLLVLATIRDPKIAMFFIAVFGFGMMTGMFALTALFSRLLHWSRGLAERGLPSFDRALIGASGLASFGFGLYLASGIVRDLA